MTFHNTTEIIIEQSQVETIDQKTFSSCFNIDFISLGFNLITEIQDGTFGYRPNLRRISLYNNLVRRIQNLAFTESPITDIDLDYNELTSYNDVAFNQISSTLKFLSIAYNQISSLPNSAFSQLSQVEYLNLGHNPIGNIPENAFHGMVNLGILIIQDCEISELHENQFRGLNSLRDLRINRNRISSLPRMIFNELWNLTEIDMDDNNLFVINAEAFGSTINTIQYLFAWSNQIFAIDPEFFDNAVELRWIFLRGNLCSDRDFLDVLFNREEVRNAIGECINFYGRLPESIECDYVDTGDNYFCFMRVFNPGKLLLNFKDI